MKKIIYNQLLKDITKFFLLSSLSLSLIIWVIQAVNFLDYISEDGHGLLTYFYITLLNFPKIFSRILPFCVFISIFYTLNRYEAKNTGSVILIISDVCKVKKPKSSHLFAPLISFPVNKVITTKSTEIKKNNKELFL